VRHGLFRGRGGEEKEVNRWIFEGLYREGHREGPGEELYETKASQTLVNFLDKKNNNNSDSNGDGGGKEDEGHAKKNGYAYDDDQGNVTALQVLTPVVIQTNNPPHFSALDNNQLNNQFTKQNLSIILTINLFTTPTKKTKPWWWTTTALRPTAACRCGTRGVGKRPTYCHEASIRKN
jgi:hypothetical protein